MSKFFLRSGLLLGVILFTCLNFYAQQNLVMNGDFEEYIYCPTTMDDFSVKDWYSPTTGSPNYLNSCNLTDASVPQNSWGYQYAHSGNAYAGFNTSDFEPSSTDAREYIQSKLVLRLEKDEFYEVSFYVSRADSSRRACDNIGLYLSENGVGSWDNLLLPFSPQVTSELNMPIENDTSWVRVIDTILAVGNEEFITIGVFSNNSNTNWVNVSGSCNWTNESYYFVDNVSIKKLHDVPNIFTPNNDGINDLWEFTSQAKAQLEIINRWGNLIYKTSGNFLSWNGEDCTDGVYFYRIITEEKVKSGYIQLIR